jgi:CxxC motif-containing protein (DUF1111 family)
MRAFPVIVAAVGLGAFALPVAFTQSAPTEAPPAFDAQMQLVTNGFADQAQFDADRQAFEEVEGAAGGLGPVYNASSCVECHRNPVAGGSSQVNELRAGHFSRLTGFVEHPGGSLINDRATDPQFQERVLNGNEVRALRASLNVLGDGFVEAIADATFQQIVASQPLGMRGQIINVPVFEASSAPSIGRFGWKDQNATLLSFAADAYVNEMGITNRFFPADNTSNGNPADDGVADPEDQVNDIDIFARFMRSTGVPPRDAALAATPEALAGERLFTKIGCANCHVATITTAPAGTVLHGGSFPVPAALGDKIIHPFSDFLLHNVGTGDGIVQNGGPTTRLKLRTPPLWGLRSRARLMHDGGSLGRNEAILRHRGEAIRVTFGYMRLPIVQKNQLIAFLNSL